MEATTTTKPDVEEQPVAEKQEKKSSSKKNWLYESLDVSRLVHYKTVIRNLPFILFLASVAILYIWNAHYSEKNVREMNEIEKQMNQMRWQYTTEKSELENMSTQSEVAKKVEPSGLKELHEPPKKIEVKKIK